jgi:hypothetical protein
MSVFDGFVLRNVLQIPFSVIQYRDSQNQMMKSSIPEANQT